MVFGFSWFCFVLFLKGLEVKPPTQWQMKPSVLLQSPPFVHLCPLPCSFPAAFTQFVCVSSAFRQLQHSDVGNVPDSCTLDQPTGLPVVPTSHLQPQSAWKFGVWNVLWLLAGFLALPSSLWGNEEEEENLQLVLCNKLSFVFCFDLI